MNFVILFQVGFPKCVITIIVISIDINRDGVRTAKSSRSMFNWEVVFEMSGQNHRYPRKSPFFLWIERMSEYKEAEMAPGNNGNQSLEFNLRGDLVGKPIPREKYAESAGFFKGPLPLYLLARMHFQSSLLFSHVDRLSIIQQFSHIPPSFPVAFGKVHFPSCFTSDLIQ